MAAPSSENTLPTTTPSAVEILHASECPCPSCETKRATPPPRPLGGAAQITVQVPTTETIIFISAEAYDYLVSCQVADGDCGMICKNGIHLKAGGCSSSFRDDYDKKTTRWWISRKFRATRIVLEKSTTFVSDRGRLALIDDFDLIQAALGELGEAVRNRPMPSDNYEGLKTF